MSESKVWVDAPFKLIPSAKAGAEVGKEVEGAKNLASEMTIVHNAILRGINAVYNQARNVSAKGTAKDKLDFANFAYGWAMMLQEHHDVEEEKVFPRINEVTGVPGLMDANVDEHKAFHDGFLVYIEYLDKVRAKKEEFDGERLVSIIDSFAPVLRDHLEHEIDSLLALDKYSDKCDWGKWFKQIVDEIVTTAMKRSEYRTDIFPLAVILHDKTFDGGVWQKFPPIPWLFAVLLRWMFMYKRKDWWRFSGCDFTSHPQELPFA
ncbi:hypothetical protein BKA56DRAFT_666700 [Ilyonectria sp. MPI-CAGE-AT-0026]|nr:hypothetical protein BKA56DRAFT_666700 [Ilyonectria sp. MPI-CAGE-AT-0026]